MDSNPLERERGITILAKNTSIRWNGTKINIVDTPGHADFGGEVERILRMVDGVLLVVDAFDGPMPQTRFVLRKALALGRTPIVVINKIDRPGADPLRVHDEVLDLFIELEARRRSSTRRSCTRRPRRHRDDGPGSARPDLAPLFETIVEHVPAPPSDADGPVPDADLDDRSLDRILGRLGIGRIERGPGARRRSGGAAPAASPDGDRRNSRAEAGHEAVRLRGTRSHRGATRRRRARSSRWRASRASRSGSTFTDVEHPERLAGIAVEEPTISVDFIVNNSPFAGKEGKFVTSRQLRERLVQGARAQRRAAGRRHRLDRHVDRVRPRRAASRHPDGDDAARRLRVSGVASARDHARGSERRAARAVRGAGDRRARGIPRRRDREARAAPRRR